VLNNAWPGTRLASFVGLRNGPALVGHCYPEGSAGLPCQAFVEMFEGFARQRDAAALRHELGLSASALARMMRALRTVLQVELAVPDNPE
jgi:hypothetical protein